MGAAEGDENGQPESAGLWAPVLVDLLNPAAVDLAGANDVKAERRERGEVSVRQHENNVIQAQGLPVMQTDEHVAALDACLARVPFRIDVHHHETAGQPI